MCAPAWQQSCCLVPPNWACHCVVLLGPTEISFSCQVTSSIMLLFRLQAHTCITRAFSSPPTSDQEKPAGLCNAPAPPGPQCACALVQPGLHTGDFAQDAKGYIYSQKSRAPESVAESFRRRPERLLTGPILISGAPPSWVNAALGCPTSGPKHSPNRPFSPFQLRAGTMQVDATPAQRLPTHFLTTESLQLFSTHHLSRQTLLTLRRYTATEKPNRTSNSKYMRETCKFCAFMSQVLCHARVFLRVRAQRSAERNVTVALCDAMCCIFYAGVPFL